MITNLNFIRDFSQQLDEQLCYITMSGRSKDYLNDALITVKDIVYSPKFQPTGLPLAIRIYFDEYQSPFLTKRFFLIKLIYESWKEEHGSCS